MRSDDGEPPDVTFLESSAESTAAGSLVNLALLAVAAVVALLALWMVVPDRSEPASVGPAVASGPPGTDGDPSTAPSPRLEVLAGAAQLAMPLTLMQPTDFSRVSESMLQVIDGGGVTSRLLDPLHFAEPDLDWPGDTVSPFIATDSYVVYASAGEIIAQDVALDEPPRRLGAGFFVLGIDGTDEVWVFGSGARWTSRLDVASGRSGERFSLVGVGHPLATVGGRLLVDPFVRSGIDTLALWSPESGLMPIPVPPELVLLGASADRLVFGADDHLSTFDPSDGMINEAQFIEPLQIRRSAVSPDGSWVALAQRESIVSLSRLDVVDTANGVVVASLDDVIEWQISWTSPDTLVAVRTGEDMFRITQLDVATGRRLDIAATDFPVVFLAP
ncbi:MAG: hypothetical protein OEU32_19250 [Acidimicrobiia bacterium]|nr:hypothetical protein [Acidimicrobiia bacterium]